MSAASITATAVVGAIPSGIVGAGVSAAQLARRGAVAAATEPSTSTSTSAASMPAMTPAPAAPVATAAIPRLTATHASVAHPIHPVAAPSAAGAVGGTVFALLFVLGLILALAWLAKRMPGIAGNGNPALRVVASLPLGPRERVVVVDVGGTQLLLGVGAGGTRALHTLDAPLPAIERPQRMAVPPFAQLLAQHFGKKS